MILGIGVDICSKKRIDNILKKLDHHFSRQILTDVEMKQGIASTDFSKYLALRFSFKEAFYKAANYSNQKLLGWKDISLLDFHNGEFKVNLSEKAEIIMKKKVPLGKKLNINVSVGDTDTLVISKVIVSYYSSI